MTAPIKPESVVGTRPCGTGMETLCVMSWPTKDNCGLIPSCCQPNAVTGGGASSAG
ncbi:hypothetical protein [Mycobacterium sp. 852002-51152_SCH6134967]|uniref:hypothetical protein n=1 Tax=Mycobacterium sp. 852002-51152_SCH6134967 TaxID=1834096 RepID=UPI0012E71464|nr:hypothetical protein [Mycobacterium sp. 852002-51152_SCH6134967]